MTLAYCSKCEIQHDWDNWPTSHPGPDHPFPHVMTEQLEAAGLEQKRRTHAMTQMKASEGARRLASEIIGHSSDPAAVPRLATLIDEALAELREAAKKVSTEWSKETLDVFARALAPWEPPGSVRNE